MDLIKLKILLPYRVFLETENVEEVQAETNQGSFGLLPRRLDCVAAIAPGILAYKQNGKTHYLAVDRGILVKTDYQVSVSVNNVVEGPDLGKLKETIKKELSLQEEREKELNSIMTRLQTGFIQKMEKLRREA